MVALLALSLPTLSMPACLGSCTGFNTADLQAAKALFDALQYTNEARHGLYHVMPRAAGRGSRERVVRVHNSRGILIRCKSSLLSLSP